MSWTDARIDELARLWAAGVSASGIAETLGDVSRSAVLGKLHRLKLLRSRKAASAPRRFTQAAPNGESGPAPPPPAAPRARTCPPEPPRSPWREEAFTPLRETTPRPWLTRAPGECAFPVGGDGAGLLSCCAPTAPRRAYCAAHHRIALRPITPAARAAEQRRWAASAEVLSGSTPAVSAEFGRAA